MSTAASHYADYSSACPRCQQIINTIDVTFQQGIFIYDLTFIQQELESVLVAALQRQNQLANSDGENLELPLSSMMQLSNGKKQRDFKAERERKRKAFSEQISRKRRKRRKTSTLTFLKSLKRECNGNGSLSVKKDLLQTKTNGNSTRPIRSYRPINFSYPYNNETNYRNGNQNHVSNNRLQLNNIPHPDQFWTKIKNHQHEFLKQNDFSYIEKLINIDQSLLNNFDYEKFYNQYKETIHSDEYLLTKEKYLHPELEYSVVLKQNLHLYNLVENLSNSNQTKNNSTLNNHRLKRKHSTMSNNQNSSEIDDSILNLFRRDNNDFSSKYAELQYRLSESLRLERLALDRAEQQNKLDRSLIELTDIDDKVLEITNSIRLRKRPSENVIALCKYVNPITATTATNNNNHEQNGNNGSEAWRKGRRRSTLLVYDELARLVDERINIEKQLVDFYPSIEI
ncbi:unnamed protein product [Rotaria magnacalcarata]|uniref:Uncharacterized protein n=1 Tax=Rotaria magnacalcarata TaxID=392030 RepID=A0A816WIU4_9BILA|nr:unnamed protein product [Rotaria magnacalcarata]CAF3999558.1 unnamed protein product [Rotaria magnacalcarata]